MTLGYVHAIKAKCLDLRAIQAISFWCLRCGDHDDLPAQGPLPHEELVWAPLRGKDSPQALCHL